MLLGIKEFKFIVIFTCVVLSSNGCAAIKATGWTAHATGKAVGVTVKTAGKVVGAAVKTAGRAAWVTARAGSKAITTVGRTVRIVIPGGRDTVKLNKQGNNLLVDALLNRKVKASLLLDTGCSDTQISREIAGRLGIKNNEGQTVLCTLADGRVVAGRAVNIKEVRVGRVRAYNVRAVVLDEASTGSHGGLLGMSFLDNFVFKIDSKKGELVLQARK
jgi:clan AA aspartic protease (TIGR02281 family)